MNFLIRVLRQVLPVDVLWDTACTDKYSMGEFNCDCVLWQFEAISCHPFSCSSCNVEVSIDGPLRNAIDLDLFYIHVVSSGNSELLNTPSPGILSNFDFCSVPLFPFVWGLRGLMSLTLCQVLSQYGCCHELTR